MTVKEFVNVVELRTKVISLSTCLLAIISAQVLGLEQSIFKTLLMVLATLLIDMGTTGFNSYYDYKRGLDTHHTRDEKDKVLVKGEIEEGEVFAISFILFLMASLIGLTLALSTSLLLIPLGVLALGIAFFYSGGPFPLSYSPLGELIAGFFLGSYLFCIFIYVTTGVFNFKILLISLPISGAIGAILGVNNGCDYISDKASGRHTLSIILGYKFRAIPFYFYTLVVISLMALEFVQFQFKISALISIIIYCIYSLLTLYKMNKLGFIEKNKAFMMQLSLKQYMAFVLIYISFILTVL